MTWHQRIDAAEKRGKFFVKERKLAQSWVTCACGEQDPRIERWSINNSPKDGDLNSYGLSFFHAVECKNFGYARTLLAVIETRAAELIAIYEKEKVL